MGPILFLLYVSDLFDVIAECGFTSHAYADDTQLYISVPAASYPYAIERFVCYVEQVRDWMGSNCLKLNEDKTQVIWLGTRQQLVIGQESARDVDFTEGHRTTVFNCSE